MLNYDEVRRVYRGEENNIKIIREIHKYKLIRYLGFSEEQVNNMDPDKVSFYIIMLEEEEREEKKKVRELLEGIGKLLGVKK